MRQRLSFLLTSAALGCSCSKVLVRLGLLFFFMSSHWAMADNYADRQQERRYQENKLYQKQLDDKQYEEKLYQRRLDEKRYEERQYRQRPKKKISSMVI